MSSRGPFREVLSPAPDWQRGELERRLKFVRGQTVHVGRAHCEVGYWSLPGASEFARDWALSSSVALLHEVWGLGIAEELIYNTNLLLRSLLGPGGRDRLSGHPILLYLLYVDIGATSVQRFVNKLLDGEMLALCGYDRLPSVSEISERFAELELALRVVTSAQLSLVLSAVQSEPKILDVVWADPTAFVSGARLHDVCGFPCDDDESTGSDDAESVAKERYAEVNAPEWGESGYESKSGRTRQPYVEVFPLKKGRRRIRAVHIVHGHRKVIDDYQAGPRAYAHRTWIGGQHYPIVSGYLGEPLYSVCGPADVNEYDLLPLAYEGLVIGLDGRRPLIWGGDRASYTRNVFEYLTWQGTAPVVPERVLSTKKTHADWRHKRFDEDGVPRCPGCGGPGNQSWPGTGFRVERGRALLAFVCEVPLTKECRGVHSVPCELEWLKLTRLSQLTEIHHAVRERHPVFEQVHHHQRQRFAIAGKTLPQRLSRRGIDVHALRAATALLLLWVRLSLRNGWLTPTVAPIVLNEASPIRLAGEQNRRSLEIRKPGIGTPRLRRLQAERNANGAAQPYNLDGSRRS